MKLRALLSYHMWIIVVLGLGLTLRIYKTATDDALKTWKDQAKSDTEWLTGTVISWLGESQLALVGLATLIENSTEVTEEEFQNAFEALEQRSSAFFVDAAYNLSKNNQNTFEIRTSSGNQGAIDREKMEVEINNLLHLAESRYGRVVMGEPFLIDEENRAVLIGLLTEYGHQENFVVGVIKISDIISSLKQLHQPSGLRLKIRGIYPHNGKDVVIFDEHTKEKAYFYNSKHITASIEIVFSWEIDPEFLGGMSRRLPYVILFSGLSLCALISLSINNILKINKRIRHEVDIATHNLNQKNLELEISQKKSQQASLAKSAFITNTSHEIRTPINAILGLNHLLKKTDLDLRQRDYVSKIGSSTEILLGIIDDVLDISKIESGEMTLKEEVFDTAQIIESIQNMFQKKAEDKELRFEVSLDTEIPPILYGDHQRLSQILLNLCSNAIKFTEKGGVYLIFSWKNITATHGQLMIQVKDTGIGLSEEQLEFIFTPFNQVDGSTTRRFGGTGLGLSITKKLTDLMDGHIMVRSELGLGSEFTLEIPFQIRESQRTHKPDDSSIIDFSGARILLVEDNNINQQVASELLEDKKAIVTIASHGQEAVQLAAENEYDIILMDLQMPIMGGYEATKIILRKDPNATIIALTADAIALNQKSILEAGMVDVITKPIQVDELYQLLNRYFTPENRPDHKNSSQKINNKLLLDVPSGLARVAGNTELYESIVHSFIDDCSQLFPLFEKLLNNSNVKDLKIHLHTLKGISGNIGAKEVYTMAVQLEQNIELSLNIFPLWEELKQVMQSTIHEILSLYPRHEKIGSSNKHARNVENIVDILSQSITEKDENALTFLREHRSLLEKVLNDRYCGLEFALEQNEYDVATKIMSQQKAA